MDRYVIKNKNTVAPTDNELVQPGSETESDESESSAPVEKRPRSTYQRKFRDEWLKLFPWLRKTETGESFCKLCKHTLKGSKRHLTRHEQRDSHIKNSNQVKGIFDVGNMLRQQDIMQSSEVTKIRRTELKLVMGIVEHNLPFLYMDHLPKLLQASIPDSNIVKKIKCCRTKSTKVVKLLKNEATREMSSDLQQVKYSLILDETTDISVHKCLAILVRYVKNCRTVHEKLLAMVEAPDCTANGLTAATLDVLNELAIPTKNIIGFAADNASVMMGNLGGVKMKLKEINPNIFVVGCICHSMHLCASHAAKKLPVKVEEFVRNIFNYISRSANRSRVYYEFQEFVDLKPQKVLKLSQTRWLSLEAVVDRVLKHWEALKLFFLSEVAEDPLLVNVEILEILRDSPQTKLYLMFLQYILPLINAINLQFQSEETQLHLVYDRITTLFKTVLKNFMVKSYVDSHDIISINPLLVTCYLPNEKLYFGEDVGEMLVESNLINTEKIEFYNNCLSYYVELALQIKKRFEGLEDYQKFTLLDPKTVLYKTEIITPLLTRFKHLCPQNKQMISNEYRQISNLPKALVDELSQLKFQEFWFRLYTLKAEDDVKLFANVCQFVFDIISLPHSSAGAERVFSQLSLIKTKSRNRLLPKTCNDVLVAKGLLNKKPCFEWEPNKELLNKKIEYD